MTQDTINKHEVIRAALLEMGFPFADSDSKEAADYKAASSLFDRAVMQLLEDDCFTFNIRKIEPALTDRRIYLGQFEYVKPEGYICSLTPGVEETGEKLYTAKNNLILKYKKVIDVKDIPFKYSRYISLALAVMLAPAVGKAKSLERIAALLKMEKEKLLPQGAFVINMEDLV